MSGKYLAGRLDIEKRASQMLEFPPFEEWIAGRIYPVAFRVGAASILVYLSLNLVDFWQGGSGTAYALSLPERAAALLFLLLMTGAMSLQALGRARAAWAIGFGLMGQALMLHYNLALADRVAYVPVIVLFFLYGVLLLAPTLRLGFYAIAALATLAEVGLLMAWTGRSPKELAEVGSVVLPALVFLGYALRRQGLSAREHWTLARESHERSTIDALSLTLTRRAWYERSGELCAGDRRGVPSEGPGAFLMLDIDHFKRVNDSFGHECGDLVIRAVAEAIVSELRPVDIVGRLGGEEFGILMPGAGTSEARAAAERVRSRVEGLSLSCGGRRVSVTLSLGVALGAGRSLEALVREGDSCLYRAKSGGRNRVVVSGPSSASS